MKKVKKVIIVKRVYKKEPRVICFRHVNKVTVDIFACLLE